MTIPVKHGGKGYDIVLERGALRRAAEYLPRTGRALVVTDDGVPPEYARCAAAACPGSTVVTVPRGEASKSIECWRGLLSRMLELSFSRSDRVIAVGGGVVGDLSGFAAASYMRGIDFYNIPTTLLSQVDSSIGGKVAVDMDKVKNVVGAFYDPRRVLIDPDVLKTLDARQLSAGLAESIKMAATCDGELFRLIEESRDLFCDLDKIIEGSLRIKRAVVEEDPTEKGLRRVLNFGHTVGHAVESLMGGAYLHGECVAVGMLPMCSPDVRARLAAVLKKYSLPTRADCDKKALPEIIRHDKKAVDGGIMAVYVDKIGSFEFRRMTIGEIEKYIEEGL